MTNEENGSSSSLINEANITQPVETLTWAYLYFFLTQPNFQMFAEKWSAADYECWDNLVISGAS